MKTLIADIFKTIGQPTVTYIERDNGKFEKELSSALDERGQLCLVTGPSKTGKTTLYRKVLRDRGEIPLIVRCDKDLTCTQLWSQALESVDFERAESRSESTSTKVSAELGTQAALGWKWLANVSAKLQGTYGKDQSESEIRQKILAEPGPDLLVPVLRDTNYVLIIEDFHYISDNEKILLFQQWKRFIDNEIPIVVLGTTHRAVDIANSNKDLIGRVKQIDIAQWGHNDLVKICRSGFDHMNVSASDLVTSSIAREAVGLPIIVQQTCLQLLEGLGIRTVDEARRSEIHLKQKDVETALHTVATTKYAQFKSYYDTLVKGPREKARKYRTYELIIGCFTLDPIKFFLSRNEIDQRVVQLCQSREVPPAASMNSTFGALKKFQERRGFELLEWLPNEEVLYIIEPSFLFYIRWRRINAAKPAQLDFLEILVRTAWQKIGYDVVENVGFSRHSTMELLKITGTSEIPPNTKEDNEQTDLNKNPDQIDDPPADK